MLASDQFAAAHMVYFLVSVALFIPLIGGMLYFMRDVTDSQFEEDVGLEPKARNLLDRLTGSPGALANGNTTWQDRKIGEALVEAGIRHDSERLHLSPEKLENLQRAALDQDDANVFVDYEELKEALGVGDKFDFHLRLAPKPTDRNFDPYGSRPLGATHVAYVGALKTPSTFDGAIDEFTDQARNEIAALKDLGLGPIVPGEAGFSDLAYYPRSCAGELPGGWTPEVDGWVVADTTDTVVTAPEGDGCLLNRTTEDYESWFLDTYFDASDGYRYDALMFGTGVDLARWKSAAANISKPGIFLDFVTKGGTLVFLENNTVPDDFITKCVGADCLFSVKGQQEAFQIPDETNQLLLAPNPLPELPTRATPWKVWKQGAENETHGFIPVVVDDPVWVESGTENEYVQVHLGATTADRYGEDGGSVILANWDFSGEENATISRVFSNFLSYGVLRIAFLDYGPQLPEDRPVRAVAKSGILELPTGEFIEMWLQIYLWRN